MAQGSYATRRQPGVWVRAVGIWLNLLELFANTSYPLQICLSMVAKANTWLDHQHYLDEHGLRHQQTILSTMSIFHLTSMGERETPSFKQLRRVARQMIRTAAAKARGMRITYRYARAPSPWATPTSCVSTATPPLSPHSLAVADWMAVESPATPHSLSSVAPYSSSDDEGGRIVWIDPPCYD